MQNLLIYLQSFFPLSEELLAELKTVFTPISCPKSEYLITPGEICHSVFFMQQGFARGVRKVNEKEVTTWFWKEEDVITNIYSFLRQIPTTEGIQTLEDCELWALSYEDLQLLYKKHIEFNIIGRKILEEYFLKTFEITFILRNMTALERYEYLLKIHPDIFQRTTLLNISSYLGVSPETISRIRKKPPIN